MLVTNSTHTSGFYSDSGLKTNGQWTGGDRWRRLSNSAILVLGSPRSGTTWLAKIFDSHPDVLYRHEPDELKLPTPGLKPAEQVREWLRQRGLRAAAKRPNFPKSWRPPSMDSVRQVLTAALALAERLPVSCHAARRIGVPDLVAPNRWGSVRAAVKLVNWDGSLAAQTMPDVRCVFILRHPCGQIASIMTGLADRQFDRTSEESDASLGMTAAMDCAERQGVDAAAFDALPDAAKHAWNWRAFNEPAVEALRELPNARVVIYEELCHHPETVARDLFAFAGLNWHPQSAAFLGSSTQHDRPAGYFDVYRATGQVADRWRQTMSAADQDAVRTVLSTSSLADCWPDLAPSAS